MAKKSNAEERYKKFHGRKPERSYSLEVPFPKRMVFLGEGLAIEYESAKKLNSRDSSGKVRGYRHKFGSGVKIYTDPAGKCLYVLGGRFRVTDWMRD